MDSTTAIKQVIKNLYERYMCLNSDIALDRVGSPWATESGFILEQKRLLEEIDVPHLTLNSEIKVKLTSEGKKIHEEWYSSQRNVPEVFSSYNDPIEDGGGWSSWSLSELISIFGRYVSVDYPPPFADEIKVLERGTRIDDKKFPCKNTILNFANLFSQNQWTARIVGGPSKNCFTIQVGVSRLELRELLFFIRGCGAIASSDWSLLDKQGSVNLVAQGIYQAKINELITAIRLDMEAIGYKFAD